MKKLRLLLVDDHAVVREGLRSLLSDGSRFDIVGDAADCVAALAEVERLKPDVVVVDLSLPGMNGTQLTRRLKQLYPDIKTIALTVHEEGGYLRSLMDAGASGYVLKRSAASELLRAIEVVASGGVYLPRWLLPEVVVQIGDFTPPGVQAMLDAWLGVTPQLLPLVIMAAITVVAGAAAARLFRWE